MLTKTRLNIAKKRSINFFKQEKKKKKSNIYKTAEEYLKSDFYINYKKAFDLLDNIEIIYDPINKHWAETDGKKIYINNYKDEFFYDINILKNTLIHEALHGIIIKNNKELSEMLEHKIMHRLNPALIDIFDKDFFHNI